MIGPQKTSRGLMKTFKVVILSFDLPHHTQRCLRSVESRVTPQQILLVHNGSSRKNISRLQKDFPLIQHLVLEKNKHFSGGANAGLRMASREADWILFITNDCQLKSVESPPLEQGLYGPHILYSKNEETDSLGAGIDPKSFRLRHLKSSEAFINEPLKYIPGTAFWIDRVSFQTLNGFDESFQTYWEDVDLSLRAQKAKIALGIIPSTQILHDVGKTCHSKNFYTTYLYQRNRKWLILKFAPHKFRALALWLRDNLRMGLQSLRQRDFQKAALTWNALRD